MSVDTIPDYEFQLLDHRGKIVTLADSGLLVRFQKKKNMRLNAALQELVSRTIEADIDDVVDITAGYCSLFVRMHEYSHAPSEIITKIQDLAMGITDIKVLPDTVLEIPVTYGGKYGPDLTTVAKQSGLSEDEVVNIHSSHPYYVYCLGFSPGFPYMGGLPKTIHCTRKDEPRPHIPAGSVGIGGTQTGIYPHAGPGGWQLIGRTPCRLFDKERKPPSTIMPGQIVRFFPITETMYETMYEEIRNDQATGCNIKYPNKTLSEKIFEQIEQIERGQSW